MPTKAKTLADLMPIDPLTLSTIADLAFSCGEDEDMRDALTSEREATRDAAMAQLRQSTLRTWCREVCPDDFTDDADREAFVQLAKRLRVAPAKARGPAPDETPKPLPAPANDDADDDGGVVVANKLQALAAPAPAPTLADMRSQGTSALMDKTVHRQWANRPDDERYTDLDSLYEATRKRAARSVERDVALCDVTVEASSDDALADIVLRMGSERLAAKPTNWAFSQLCAQAAAPPKYLRTLPAHMAATNLDYGLHNCWATDDDDELTHVEAVNRTAKLYLSDDGATPTLMAATSTKYGRVQDYQVVDAVRRIAGSGTGDASWQVPGALDWTTGKYSTRPQATTEQTTLYASDRDVFMFLVDHGRPIEVGKLHNGDPDVLYRGFYVWNSEVGSTSLGLATFYLRGVCANRIIWGVEGYSKLRIVHSVNAPARLAEEVSPALDAYASTRPALVVEKARKAQQLVLAKSDDEMTKWLCGNGYFASSAKKVIAACEAEEQRECRTLWDAVQGATAWARSVGAQNHRMQRERKAGALLDKYAA